MQKEYLNLDYCDKVKHAIIQWTIYLKLLNIFKNDIKLACFI